MSDYRAVAATTVTLQNLLSQAIKEPVPGAVVTSGPPRDLQSHECSEGVVNVFLYKVYPNATWRNEELPYRRSDGTLIRRPQMALDLHYLLTFYGDDSKQIPTLLLGLSMSALHAEPYPSTRHVPQADGDPAEERGDLQVPSESPDLGGAGLLSQPHPLYFTFLPPGQDDVTQIWSTLFHFPYSLSVAYLATVVLIEPLVVPEPALPVRQAVIHTLSTAQPQLEEVSPQYLRYAPGAELVLRGRRLDAKLLRVLVGELDAEPIRRSATEVTVLLPDGIQAGAHLVRVAHGRPLGPEGEVHWDVETHPLAFLLRPVVLEAAAGAVPEDSREPADPPQPPAVRRLLHVKLAPAVRARTEVVLMLNESPLPSDRAPRRYAFHGVAEPSLPDVLQVAADLLPGRYLVRVQIRGVPSPLTVDEDPESPTYRHYKGPVITVR